MMAVPTDNLGRMSRRSDGSDLHRSRRVGLVVMVVALSLLTFSMAGAQSTAKVTPESLRIRAFGDGVTAGYGYDSRGVAFALSDRTDCQWRDELSVGRCSSNSELGPTTPSTDPLFASGGGLTNGVSWAAQVAAQLRATDFANFAVSGSRLLNWMDLPADDQEPEEGRFHGLLDQLIADDPDLVLVSVGGSILLDLPGGPSLACARFHDAVAEREQFAACIDQLLAAMLVKQRIMAISFDVLAHTLNAKIVLTSYLPPSPLFSFLDPWQLNVMTDRVTKVLGEAVDSVKEAGASWATRITLSPSPANPYGNDSAPCDVPRGPLRWSTKTIAEGCPLVSRQFAALSAGTVPSVDGQKQLAATALAAIRQAGWN